MICLAVAANLLPAHPRAAAWQEKAIEYMINTLSVPQDAQEQRLVDGRPVSEWFAGANLQPDFTLENHNIFHPSYVACSSYFLTQAAMYYMHAGVPSPRRRPTTCWTPGSMFQTILLPAASRLIPKAWTGSCTACLT